MKHWSKKILITSLVMFWFLALTPFVLAQTDIDLMVKIGNQEVKLAPVNCDPGANCTVPWIGEYIAILYKYGVSVAVILAVVMIMVGGFVWLTSAGSPDRVGKAKEFITAALSGLMLALFSFIVLQGVNPELVKLNPVSVDAPDVITVASIGPSEGVNSPRSSGGVAASNVPLGTNSSLAQIPGHGALDGARPELNNTMDAMVQQLAQNGQLPAGLQITSGHRPGDQGSQHALGTAVDFWWPGIDLASAYEFERVALGYNSNFTVLTEVRGDPDFRYFRGSGNGVVHIDMRNILGTR